MVGTTCDMAPCGGTIVPRGTIWRHQCGTKCRPTLPAGHGDASAETVGQRTNESPRTEIAWPPDQGGSPGWAGRPKTLPFNAASDRRRAPDVSSCFPACGRAVMTSPDVGGAGVGLTGFEPATSWSRRKGSGTSWLQKSLENKRFPPSAFYTDRMVSLAW